MMKTVGIDISKKWFDGYCLQRSQLRRFVNTSEGWNRFGEWAGADAHCVMEASGPYYLGLASWLVEQGVVVSVVNPLVIRRYSQMRLTRTKTDGKDAELIAGYGAEQRPAPWTPPSGASHALRQLLSLREGLLRQQSILAGQREAFSQHPAPEPLVMGELDEQASRIRHGLARIDARMQQLAEQHYAERLHVLLTIPGIGPKTAIMLLCLTDGFARFEDARSLASYVGICPRVWQSGSSINARGAICKLGCSQLRKLLYMCTWTAKTANPACRQMYQRLKAAGKPERVIKVALAHKLLRQAYAVGSKLQPFEEKNAMAA